MKDKKIIKGGFLKKGLVLCLVGAMAFGMMACGSSNKKKDSTQTKVKTESNKEQGSTGKTDISQPKSSVGTKKQDKKADAEQPKSSAGTQKEKDTNTKKDIKDTQTSKTKESSSSKK